MVSNDVTQAISYWTNWANKRGVKRYDIALLKIWIQFERFVSELFVSYATGQPSEKGYIPQRKLEFQNEEHLNPFLREKSKKYIEYIEKIEKLSAHIFVSNPFDILLSDDEIKTSFNQIKAIRNYIAHESGEAKSKIISMFFNNDERKFKEPNELLKKIKKSTGRSYYTYYVQTIENIVELLINPVSGTIT